MISQLRTAVDEIKQGVSSPITDIKGHADDLGQFFQIVTDEAKSQITGAQTRVATIRDKLSRCNNIEDVINMVIQQIFEMVGLESDFEIDDIRQLWVDVGGSIDDAIVWATALASGQPTEAPAG